MKKIKLVDNTEITFEELALSDSNGIPHVMTLLQEKRLNPEDVPEELLSLKNNSSISVLNVCIERLKEPVPDNDGQIVPRALFPANKHGCGLPLHFRKVKEILRIARENGWSVAHEMASQNLLPESMMTEEILSLTNDTGYAVAYAAAWHDSLPGWAKRRRDILLLENGKKDYVAHVLARLGKLPEESMTKDILKLKNHSKCPVAYYAAEKKSLPAWAKKCKNILMLENGQKDFVVYVLIRQDDMPAENMTEEILKLTTKTGYSVAYFAAWHDSLPDWAKQSRDILLLGNGQGDYVVHILASRGKLPVEMMTPDILRLENNNGITVLLAIVSGKHLSPEILMLPWNKKIRIFKYLSSAEFLNQNLSEQTIKYVKEQLAAFEALVWKKSFSTLSVIDHNHEDMER